MKMLINGTGSYLTGDDIADAVMRYGVALANERRVDLVDVPFVAAAGAVQSVQLTVGWRVELASEHADRAGDELIDGDVAGDLRARTAGLHMSGDTPLPHDEVSYLAAGDDL